MLSPLLEGSYEDTIELRRVSARLLTLGKLPARCLYVCHLKIHTCTFHKLPNVLKAALVAEKSS